MGPFSQYFSISQQAIRYYINNGLLCPSVKNARYDFSEKDIEDMELLLKLKSYRFSLADIHKIISLKRFSDFDDPTDLNNLIEILSIKRNELLKEKEQIESVITAVENEIAKASLQHSSVSKFRTGLPLSFLEYLACPKCTGSLNWTDCCIENRQILSGTLECGCGFSASVQNGILIGSPGKISKYDWPDIERNSYRFMNPRMVSYMQDSYHWILEKLALCVKDNSLVLEDFINDYCFCQANIKDMNPNAKYIITDKYPEIVALYKRLIDKLELDRQILYIAAASNSLPLKRECIDVYIDFDSSNECSLFNNCYSTDAIAKYLKRDSYAVGAFFSFLHGSDSLRKLHKVFPETWEKSYDKKYFGEYIHSTWEKVINHEVIGEVMNNGGNEKTALYHIPGNVELDVYFANGLKK